MRIKFSIIFMIIGAVLFNIVILAGEERTEQNPPFSEPDLSNHPMYAKYEFSKEKNIINIGAQPLWLPTGLITAAMKRDIVLRSALSEMNREIRFYGFLKGDDVNFFLKRGDLAGGIAGDMPVISAAATFDIMVTNMVQQGFTSIVARHHMLMSELRGKPIGYAVGSNAHYSLLLALSSVGLNEKNVHLISMDVDRMPDALHAREIDAFSAWEPIPAITLLKYDNAVIIHRNLNSGYLCFLKTFSAEYPEEMHRIVAAVIRAFRWMQSDRKNLRQASFWFLQAAKALTDSDIGISAAQIEELSEKDIMGKKQSCYISENDLKQGGLLYQEFEFLKSLAKIPPSTDWEKVHNSFNRDVINQVLANPKKYKLNVYNYITEETDDE